MLKFKDFRISQKLTLVFGLLVVFAGMISAVSYYSLQKILTTNALVYQLNQINLGLHELRLTEKNFMMRDAKNELYYKTGNSNYLKDHKKHFNEILSEISALTKNHIIVSLDLTSELNEIKSSLISYENYFHEYLKLINQAGFKDYGLEGVLRNDIHAVESSEDKYDAAGMLMLRRNEKDFFIRKDLQYQEQLHANAEKFKASIRQGTIPEAKKQKLLTLINNYINTFDREVEVIKKIGLTVDEGFIGKMRAEFLKQIPKFNNVILTVKQYEQKTIQNSKNILLDLIIFTLIVGLLLTIIMTRIIEVPIKKLYLAAQQFGKGNLDVSFDVYSKDEIGQLAQTFRNLINDTRKLSSAAEEIGKGVLDVEITPRSNEDVLSRSLLMMRDNLQKLDKETKQQIWIKTQIGKNYQSFSGHSQSANFTPNCHQ